MSMLDFDPGVYPRFTPAMKQTHTILIPSMAPIHFALLERLLLQEGYHVRVLKNGGSEVSQLGLKYVHNDTCYPALLVIGQFIEALRSGEYDPDRTALLITQTGGGCRASNYIHLLRKALVKAGYPQVPVASLNFSGLERDSGFKLTLPLIHKLLAAVFCGDLLMSLRNQVLPYETQPGEADALTARWIEELSGQFGRGHGVRDGELKKNFVRIVRDFAAIPVRRTPKVRVGVVGEIYVKYSPLGNNCLEDFLRGEDCEVNVPGLMGFLQYCIFNTEETKKLYGGSLFEEWGPELLLGWLDGLERAMHRAIQAGGFHAPKPFKELVKLPEGIIGLGTKMGEGWLLTAEMVELVQTGYGNIVCAQPFGCLPNHIVGKGMIGRIRALYPESNITPIDYDPSATRVNQENRIKLMLAVAKERLNATEAEGL